MTAMDRFFARMNRAQNADVIATRIDPEAHLGRVGNPSLKPTTHTRQPKPAVRTYTAPVAPAQPPAPTPEALEAERQAAILATRLENLTKARAVKAANAHKPARKETAPVSHPSEIETLRAQIAALSAQIERLSAPAPVSAPAKAKAKAKAKAPATPAAPAAPAPVAKKPARTPYVPTALALTNHKHGRYSLKIDTTLVTLAWNGPAKRWDYICGTHKGSAADRGAAVAQINLHLSNANLPPVRA